VGQEFYSLAATIRGGEGRLWETILPECVPATWQAVHSSYCLGDDQASRGTSGHQERLATHIAPQFCHPSAATRRRLAFGPGAVRTQRHLDDSDLHPHDRCSSAVCLQPTSPSRTSRTHRREGLNTKWCCAYTVSGDIASSITRINLSQMDL